MNIDRPGTLEQNEPAAYLQSKEPLTPRRKSRWWLWLLLLLLLGIGAYFLWPKGQAQKTAAPTATPANARARGFGAVPVVAAKARKGDIGVYITDPGSVVPIYTVTVKSRVDGQLMEVHYKEGDLVRQGDALVEIDPRPFQVQLTQAEGQLIKDQAALDNAKIDLARYETLLTHNAVPEQQVATQKALVQQYEGAVRSDQGQIDSAKLNLVYSHITAPISGRVGLRLVDPGNIVHASDANGLLVITQIQPISVIFPIAGPQVPIVLGKIQSGQKLRVDALDRDKNLVASGTLATIDNQIDPTTDTLKLRANFDNRNNALFPNEFVNARLLVEEKHDVTLVPTDVVQRNSLMTYVFLVKPDSSVATRGVKPDSSVTVREVKVGTTEGDESEITSGLSPGDVVVLSGVDRLREGAKVTVQMADAKTGRGNR